jgi:NitT/TauT family transport system substrate-binding protein
VAYSSISANWAPVYVAQEARLFQKHGLEVELVYLAGGSKTSQAMAAGEIPIGLVAASSLVAAALAGSPQTLVATSIGVVTMSLYVSPEIRRVEDLKGKKIGVTRFGSSTDLSARALLSKYRMEPGTDAAILQMGGMPEILAGLVSKAVSAGVISMPTIAEAEKAGFKELVDIPSAVGLQYPHVAVGATRDYLQKSRENVKNFLRAYIEGTARFYKDKDLAKRAIGKWTKTEDPEVLERTYVYQARYFQKVPLTTDAGVQVVLDELARQIPKAKEARPADLYDNSLVRELAAEGFIDQVFGK